MPLLTKNFHHFFNLGVDKEKFLKSHETWLLPFLKNVDNVLKTNYSKELLNVRNK